MKLVKTKIFRRLTPAYVAMLFVFGNISCSGGGGGESSTSKPTASTSVSTSVLTHKRMT